MIEEKYIFAAIAVTAILLSLVLIFRKKQRYPYFSRKTLLTDAEQRFYSVLKAATVSKYDISCKVRLADLINCSDTNWRKGYGPQISSKHIDFVLINPETSQIILAIELDDKSHDLLHRQKRDAFVDKALESAFIPILRIKVKKGYDLAFISYQINLALNS